MDALTMCWIAVALLMALAGLGGCLLVLRSHRREPRSFDGYAFAVFAFPLFTALIALAVGLGRVGGAWAATGIIVINVLVQPLCLYILAGSIYKLVMALAGRVTYAWHVVPMDTWPEQQYRSVRWHCLSQGILGGLFAGGMGGVCFWPLL
jgi:hypothetical protein